MDSGRPRGKVSPSHGHRPRETPTERRVSPPSVGQTPLGNGWRGFLFLPFRQLKPPLGAPHASPQLPLSRRYPGPLLGYPFDRDAHSRRGRLFEWALGWRVAFASPPGGGSLQNPAVGPWDGRSPSLSRASRRLPLGRRWEWTSPLGTRGSRLMLSSTASRPDFPWGPTPRRYRRVPQRSSVPSSVPPSGSDPAPYSAFKSRRGSSTPPPRSHAAP